MTFTRVGEWCPSTEKTWKQRAKKCTRSDHYHCLLNENSVLVEGCINPIWVESGNCPVYNSKAFKLDAQKCRAQVCPDGVYRSNDLFKYIGCFIHKRTSKAPVSLNDDASTTQTNTTLTTSTQPKTSFSAAAVVVPIILVLVILVVIAAIVWYKSKRYRDQHASNGENGSKNSRLRVLGIFSSCNKTKTTQQETDHHVSASNKRSENSRLKRWRILICSSNKKETPQQQTENGLCLEENELLRNDTEEGPSQRSISGAIADCPSPKDSKQNDGTESFTREELLKHMNITTEGIAEEASHISDFATVLLKNNTLALIGERGSGKRTLSVQIAIKMENVLNEKIRFKVIHHFDEISEPIMSGLSQPTVIMLPDLYKFWYTDHQIEDVKNFLIRNLSIAKDKKLYIIGSFTENAWKSFTSHFLNENVDSLFPVRKSINLSLKTLSSIGEKNHFDLKETEINEILKVRSVGKPLITILYCKNLAYRKAEFLKNPLTFIMHDLRRMRDSSDMDDRMKFRVLAYTMLQGGNVEVEVFENDIDHPLFEEMNLAKDRQKHIKGCVTQLLNGYMEKTSTGKSYRMLHDIITRCMFLIVAEKEPELMFKECNPLLLFDCIRLKRVKEKIWDRGQYSFDYDDLSMGIPTESFRKVARIFKQRNEILAMLKKVKLLEDKYFLSVWNNI